MINIKNHKQGDLFDPWDHMGPKRRKLLEDSWAGTFREHVLENLPVEEIAKFFKDDFGRPTKELYTIMGALIIQQMFDLTIEELIENLAFNEQYHFALNITDESDSAKYICPKTIFNMQNIFINNNIDEKVFEKITDSLAKDFDVDISKQRIDSVNLKSNMAKLGRIGIMSKTINKFLVNLKRQHRDLFDELPEELTGKYLTEKAMSCFSMVKPSESAKKLAELAQDLFELSLHFSDNKHVAGMTSFQMLLRVLHEQCKVTSNDKGEPIEVAPKPAKEVPSDSLQNPSDPDAGYDGHKGQGFQAQVMETYSEETDPEKKDQQLDLIDYIHLESAAEHDSKALVPAIESAQERGLGPEVVLADSLYGSDENIEAAKELGVEVVAPAMGKREESAIGLNDFTFDDNCDLTSCPAGHAPVKVKQNKKKKSAAFDLELCAGCPHRDDCPAKPGKKYRYLHYDEKDIRLAERRATERTDEFKDRYRMRSGVEATMSQYDRLTGVKRLRVRGLNAVRFCVTLKATAVNIFRATSVRNARKAAQRPPAGRNSGVFRPIYVFKERLLTLWDLSCDLLSQCLSVHEISSQMSA
jgi:hypothetical protein